MVPWCVWNSIWPTLSYLNFGLFLFQTQSAARANKAASSDGSKNSKMDLVYVTERIISLVFPEPMEDVSYTYHLREIAHMLSSKHGDTFRVRNTIYNPH